MTVRDLVTAALAEIGVGRADEALDPGDAAVALGIFIAMVDLFQADRLLLYTVLRSVFPLVAGTQTYTIGTGGAFNIARPLWIAHAGVTPVGSTTEEPLDVYHNRDVWLAEPDKGQTDSYPRWVLYEPTFPLGTLTFWPKPLTAASVALALPVPLTTPVDLDTVLILPPGYEEAWRLNLAKRLCRPFDQPVTPDLLFDAREALGVVKRLNDDAPPFSRSDPAVLGPGGFDIRTNGYRP